MSKHAKGHKHPPPRRRDDTAGVKPKPAYYMIFIALLVGFSIVAILICSGTWTPW